MIGKRSICFFLFFWSSLLAFSQGANAVGPTTFAPAINFYPGYLVKNYADPPNSNVVFATGVQFTWQTWGRDDWHKYYRFPKIGFECYYANFGNREELGHAFGFIPVLEFEGKKKKNWRLKLGLGATYLTNPYDPVTNPTNFYFGGKFANLSIASIHWSAPINKKMAFTYGFTAMHCSNGHNALPNAGANMLMLNAGVKWFGNDKSKSIYQAPDKPLTHPNHYSLRLSIGTHEFGEYKKAVGGPSYPSYHASVYWGHSFKHIHIVQAGITWAYYSSFNDYIVSQEVYSDKQQLRSCTGIVFLGHEFVMGKVSFMAQGGIYFYNPFFIKQKKIDGSWSKIGEKIEAFNTNRLGLVYYPFKKKNTLNNVKNQLSFGIFIKANMAVADLFEYAVGFSF